MFAMEATGMHHILYGLLASRGHLLPTWDFGPAGCAAATEAKLAGESRGAAPGTGGFGGPKPLLIMPLACCAEGAGRGGAPGMPLGTGGCGCVGPGPPGMGTPIGIAVVPLATRLMSWEKRQAAPRWHLPLVKSKQTPFDLVAAAWV
eukprot:scaffold3366_cov365-Prasinococcus_capsulatus_cf.AAC.9